MEITAEEAAALLSDERNLANSKPQVLLSRRESDDVTYVKAHNGSRGNGGTEVPPLIRTLIGAAAHFDTIKSVSDAFNVSPSTTAAAKAGRIGVNHFSEELKAAVDSAVTDKKKDLREAALDRLSSMFAGVINEQNLNTLKPREAVSAAKDIATIVDRLTPKAAGANVAVFVHAPRVKSEEEFGEAIVVAHRAIEEKKLT